MRKSLQLFAGSVGPALISEITTLWFAVASLLLLVGLAAISIKSYLEKKRQDKRLKTASKR
jgi:ABC-type sulfate transport system permease subunit